MALVQRDDAVERTPSKPLHELVKARATSRRGHQRGVRREQHAVRCLRALQRIEILEVVNDAYARRTDVVQVALRVAAEVRTSGNPQVPSPASRDVVQDHRCDLPSLPHARAVAEEEPCALLRR